MGATIHHILHVDMDAFYAAVEQLDNPALRGHPVLVGGDPSSRGVVSTASYEARPFGCHSAMPMATAIRLCPQAVVVPPRFDRYSELSRQLFEILEQVSPLVEPLSIDEAFVDVTGSVRLLGSPTQMARDVKNRIRERTRLTASVGVAPNKFLAKLASDLEKPDGLVVVPHDGVQAFLDPLPITRMWGVGKATLPRFEGLGVRTFGDLRQVPLDRLEAEFREHGRKFHQLAHGKDDRTVVPDHEAKSISHEITFARDIGDLDHLRRVVLHQTEQVAGRLRRQALLARTVRLKIRYDDFRTITRSTTLPVATDETDVLWSAAAGLFEAWASGRVRAVRLIGAGVSQLSRPTGRQMTLFEDEADGQRRRRLDRTLDAIRDRYGHDAVSRGGS
jgi:DNA polymerase-4